MAPRGKKKAEVNASVHAADSTTGQEIKKGRKKKSDSSEPLISKTTSPQKVKNKRNSSNKSPVSKDVDFFFAEFSSDEEVDSALPLTKGEVHSRNKHADLSDIEILTKDNNQSKTNGNFSPPPDAPSFRSLNSHLSEDVIVIDKEDDPVSKTRVKTGRTKRGIILTDDNDIYNDLSIIPEADIFSSQIEEYKEKSSPEQYSKTIEDHESSNERDDCTLSMATCSKSMKSGSRIEIDDSLPMNIRVKVNKIWKDVDKRRQRTEQMCKLLLPAESTLLSDEDDDVLCINHEENREICVKVRYRKDLHRFTIKRGEKFYKVFVELAKKYKVDVSTIMLYLKDSTVKLEDTPGKLNLTVADILDCCILNSSTKENDGLDDNWITVKLQANDTKEKHSFTIHKLESFSSVMKQYSEHRGIPLEKMTFLFDGEKVNPADHPIELDLENDSVVDVRVL